MLKLKPITLRAANKYVREVHRHHDPVRGHKFSASVVDEDGILRGVAIAGRPVSRMLDNGITLEVTRCCTDGARNACSMLYGACRRAGFAVGYLRIITYTLPSEAGSSLKAAGFSFVGLAGGGEWSRPSRKRTDHHPTEVKWLWECRA